MILSYILLGMAIGCIMLIGLLAHVDDKHWNDEIDDWSFRSATE